MSHFNLSWSAGIIIGPFLAGILSSISAGIPLYAGAFLFIATGLLATGARFMLPGISGASSAEPSQEVEAASTDTSTALRFPAWVGIFTTFVVIGVILNIFPLFARDELLLPKKLIGTLMLSRTFIATFFFILMGHTSFWHFRVLPMVAGQVGLAFSIFIMNFASSPPALVLLISLIGALRALSYNVSLFHGVSGSINRMGRIAIHESLIAAGLICGSSVGGLLYQRYSMTAAFYFCAFLVLTGVAVQSALGLLFTRRPGMEKG